MIDALRAHLEATGAICWARPTEDLDRRLAALSPRPRARDAHLEYVADVDAARDPVRAERMAAAIALARADARAGRALDWPALQRWQRLVSGEADAPFRSGEGFAKRGAERYGLWPGLEEEFAAKLAQDSSDGVHPAAAAARAYLDLCFFHPFADGNARAGRLALDYWLTRAGLALGHARLLFAAPRVAGRRAGYLGFLGSVVRACEVG